MVKRAIFMFCTMLPVLIYAEYTHKNSIALSVIAAAVTSGVSVVLFPDPAFLEKKKREKAENEPDDEKND